MTTPRVTPWHVTVAIHSCIISAGNRELLPMGTNSVGCGPWPRGGVAADRGSEEAEMADVKEEEAMQVTRDVMMTKTKIVTTTATVIETETEAGALATKVKSDPIQMQKVIGVDDCGPSDGSQMQGGRSVLPIATE